MEEPRQVSAAMWGGPPAGRLRDLPEPDRTQFYAWLRGQTIPVLNGVPDAEQDAFYLHDYRRWKSSQGRPQQGWF